MDGMNWGLLYAAGINGIAFCAYGLDKRRAVRGEWRISERTLLLLAFLGGAAGAFLGMKVFHHKTRHRKFSLGVPLLLLMQAAGCWLFF